MPDNHPIENSRGFVDCDLPGSSFPLDCSSLRPCRRCPRCGWRCGPGKWPGLQPGRVAIGPPTPVPVVTLIKIKPSVTTLVGSDFGEKGLVIKQDGTLEPECKHVFENKHPNNF